MDVVTAMDALAKAIESFAQICEFDDELKEYLTRMAEAMRTNGRHLTCQMLLVTRKLQRRAANDQRVEVVHE